MGHWIVLPYPTWDSEQRVHWTVLFIWDSEIGWTVGHPRVHWTVSPTWKQRVDWTVLCTWDSEI